MVSAPEWASRWGNFSIRFGNSVFQRLEHLSFDGRDINVAVVGSGFVARGLVYQLSLTPAMRCSLIVARSPDKAREILEAVGIGADPIITDEPDRIDELVAGGSTAIATDPNVLGGLSTIDVVVEATGHVEYGARVAIIALSSRKHVVTLNFETDATVGPLLSLLAAKNGVVYSGSDGDQPGVLMELVRYVRGIGLDVVAAVNCKGYLDRHATPESILPWARKQGTSPLMTTAFTDGTKMNVENACVANATGLLPSRRGMVGIETSLDEALTDFQSAFDESGVVDYTLGGDFGGGVFVIGAGAHRELAAPYLEYLKMGGGPWHLFYRPWHLVQFETPLSIAKAFLDGLPTIAPMGAPIAEVVTLAKRPLEAGTHLDGIGGYDCYGEIDTIERSSGLVPVGLSHSCTLRRRTAIDQPIAFEDVEIEDTPIVRLWHMQSELFESSKPTPNQEAIMEIVS